MLIDVLDRSFVLLYLASKKNARNTFKLIIIKKGVFKK